MRVPWPAASIITAGFLSVFSIYFFKFSINWRFEKLSGAVSIILCPSLTKIYKKKGKPYNGSALKTKR